MNLDGYFRRIGHTGAARADLHTLRAVHRAHALNIPYENLDVILKRPVSMAAPDIYDKIVNGGRGGWCYEMNGLLEWALREIGFRVTRMTGGVMREHFGDEAFGNHLVLRVDLDQPWIADTGIGDCFIEPLPMTEGEHRQDHRHFRLERLTDDQWRLHNRAGARPPSFDFIDAPADEALLSATCHKLQNDPESMFRRYLVVQQMSERGGSALLNQTLTDLSDGAAHELTSTETFTATLTGMIGSLPAGAEGLWGNIPALQEIEETS